MVGPPKKDAQQAAKFRKTARELGTDVSEDAFNRVLKRVASASPTPMPKTKKQVRKARIRLTRPP
jgi:hypothetical protein